jgi:hypothetical protein
VHAEVGLERSAWMDVQWIVCVDARCEHSSLVGWTEESDV